ncbi:prolyl oligopeptidase family serine peptidase [Novosphingobium sp. 9U]|uniref:S9 family peptidase n=1 Tax=Novosphingobium sp. 9U TaxID=2653158 RepID=UPI0012F2C093|nr:prolyl oligopeptidase family serine peptidase [Novosphingobium sp. 9U]VWX49768.1 conserved exported hypothetical protein [Novosphingobium sp. 9U]
MRSAVLVLAWLASLFHAAQASARSYTVDDLLRLEAIGKVLVDPAGRWLAFEKREGMFSLKEHGRIAKADVLRSTPYVVDLASPGRAQPLLTDGRPSGTILLGFSPGGRHLAIARLEGDRFRLGTVNLASREVRWWPFAPSYDPFHSIAVWVDDVRLVVIAQEDDRAAGWLVADTMPRKSAAQRGADTAAGRLGVTSAGSGRFLDLQKHSERRLLLLDLNRHVATASIIGPWVSLAPAPSGSWLAATRQAGPLQPAAADPVHEDTPYMSEELLLLRPDAHSIWSPCDTCTLAGVPSWNRRGDTVVALIVAHGRQQILLAQPAKRFVALLPAPRGRASAAGSIGCPLRWRGQELVVPGTDSARAKGPAEIVGRLSVRVSGSCANGQWPVDGADWIRVSSTTPLRFIDAQGHRQALTSGMDNASDALGEFVAQTEALPLGGKTGATLLRLRKARGAEQLVLLRKRAMTPLINLNTHMKDVEPATWRALVQNGRDGKQVSWLVLPPGTRRGAPLPLVVFPYPGQIYSEQPPADQQLGGERYYTSAQLLAASGFAVLLPSLPMPRVLPDQGYPFARAIEKVLEEALGTGCCDRARVGLWGHSYGAYAAAMAASQSSRFHAIVASSGIYDLAGTVGTFGPGTRASPERMLPVAANYAWAEEGQGRMGGAPWSVPLRYVANSPVYLADKIQAPMLITAADQDVSPLGQAEQLFSALFRQGKPAQLVTYWGEGHVVSSPANLRDLYARVTAFFRSELNSKTEGQKAAASEGQLETPRLQDR